MKIPRTQLLFLLLHLLISALLPITPAGATGVKTGAEILANGGFAVLRDKKVGIITNQTGQLGREHIIDLLSRTDGVTLTALFAPEHGLRGEAADGAAISSGRDPKSGVIIYSLYGKTRQPTPEMLKGLDILLFDLQDVGSRYYTYISTMGLAMEAAAKAGITFMVLDRPNPLGGEYVSGFLMTPAHSSFTGLYPIPQAHGMTVGELARMIKGEKMLPGLEQLDLKVVTMTGWQRQMGWPETGLTWVPPSPNLRDFTAALAYAGTGLLESTALNEGRGTETPFLLAGMPGLPARELAANLNRAALPGVHFTATRYTPGKNPGVTSTPRHEGREIPGLRLEITDHKIFKPVETAVQMLSRICGVLTTGEKKKFFRKKGFGQQAGTDRLQQALLLEMPPEEIIALWQGDVQKFREQRKAYLLY